MPTPERFQGHNSYVEERTVVNTENDRSQGVTLYYQAVCPTCGPQGPLGPLTLAKTHSNIHRQEFKPMPF